MTDTIKYVSHNGHIDKHHALIALSALSQETRLEVFRILIEYGSEGMPAGKLGEQLGVPHNTLSFHLSHLSNAGLVNARKEGRLVIYSADCEAAEGLVKFLVSNCCTRVSQKNDFMASFVGCTDDLTETQVKK